MAKGTGGSEWLKQLAVAIGYALTYLAIRPFSDSHWALTSGLRLLCLLLIPYRYWLALAIGESVPLAYGVFQCADQFGYTWATLESLPPIATAMPIVWYCRRHLGLFPAKRIIDMQVLLICVLATSLTWALITYGGMLTGTVSADDPVQVRPVMIAGMFIGNFVAILTLVTWPLFVRIENDGAPLKTRIQRIAYSSLAKDSVAFLLPLLIVLSIIAAHIGQDTKSMLFTTMFLPVVWLTVKHGWRGAAVGGPLVVVCVCILTSGNTPDPFVIQNQVFLAFAVTCLFVLGARITAQQHKEATERQGVRNALRVAQQCIQQGEMRLRHTANALNTIGGLVSITQSRFYGRVQRLLTHDERQALSDQTDTTRNQLNSLAESIHPLAWRERGLLGALRESIGCALDEAGIVYVFTIEGRGLSQLASTVHQAIYRLACEGISHVCAQHTSSEVRVTLRGGQQANGRRWAVLRVVGIGGQVALANSAFRYGKRQSIGVKLGTQGMNETALKDQASLFGGTARVQSKNGAITVSILLHDAQHLAQGMAIESAQPRLWVR